MTSLMLSRRRTFWRMGQIRGSEGPAVCPRPGGTRAVPMNMVTSSRMPWVRRRAVECAGEADGVWSLAGAHPDKQEK